MRRKIFLVILLLVAAATARAQTPLFASDESLALTIKAPMRDLIRAKANKEEYDGVVTYQGPTGETISLDVKVSARGNARLSTCAFPPIRIEFDLSTTAGTVFEGQKRLKMVTHCKSGHNGERWVLQEYGIYRAYNVITEYSHLVRRLNMVWLDTESERWSREAPAFFIEDADDTAARFDRVEIKPPEVKTEQYHLVETTRHMLFQYLIGNTDFSVKRGPEGEGCCHNAKVIAPKGSQENWIVVPYDFDQAGIINTDYALPDDRLGIRRVTQRKYRGFCWQNDPLKDAVALFNERREAITAALVPTEIAESRQRRIRRFIDRFYETVNDPEELQDELIAECRGGATFAIRKTRTAGE